MNRNGGADTRIEHYMNEFNLAIKSVKDCDEIGALKHIGTGLHPLQDFYAHGDWNPHYGPHPPWYDWWGFDYEKSRNTRDSSLNYLSSGLKILRRLQ